MCGAYVSASSTLDPRRRLILRGRVEAAVAPRIEPARRPPWALQDDATFTQTCTRCNACVQACAAGVLLKGDGGYPVIDFSRAGCTLCGACVQACEPQALSRMATTSPFAWRAFIGDACLNLRRVECRSCVDTCDARALRYTPRLGGIGLVSVDADACTGCGACVAVCPTQAVSLPLHSPDNAAHA